MFSNIKGNYILGSIYKTFSDTDLTKCYQITSGEKFSAILGHYTQTLTL